MAHVKTKDGDETILPHSSPYNETVSVIPQQRRRDGKTHLVEQYCEKKLRKPTEQQPLQLCFDM